MHISCLSKNDILSGLKIYLFWDTNQDIENYKTFLRSDNDTILSQYEKQQLYIKMLNGLSWHTILKVLPPQRIKEILNEDNINLLFPKSRIAQYKYVRRVLFE